jgi:UDP:flavonoid glycosyltransferase YjiC (YdhE family)
MARIAFAWELGGELGHAIGCWSNAAPLAARGHQVGFLFRELHNLRFLPGPIEGFEVMQAPRIEVEGAGETMPVSFAEILRGCGYRDPDVLAGLITGWRELFAKFRPDLVVEDYAPTALLAARIEGIPRVRCGNGFCQPPRLAPIPPFRFDAAPPAERVRDSEAQVLAVVNGALAKLGVAPLDHLAQQFEAADDLLCTFPELDAYGSRPTSGYWGPNLQTAAGEHVEWTGLTGKRVFVYVKRHLGQVDALIDALAARGCQVVAFIPELEPERRARLEGPGRVASRGAVRLDAVLNRCDLVVSHGGTLAPGSLMRGIPQLVFPSQYEQYLTGVRLQQMGVGRWVGPREPAANVRRALDTVLDDPRYGANARAYAKKYPNFTPKEQRRRIVARIEQLATRR